MKNNDTEKYWNRFLKTGKVEDFLKYRSSLNFTETKTDIEIGKISENHETKTRLYRNRSEKS